MSAAPYVNRALQKRRRELLTPEGLSLPLTVASRGARAGALMLDLAVITVGLVVLVMVFAFLGISLIDAAEGAHMSPALELIAVIIVLLLFLARYGYFMGFELGPRGATPGKRMLGIRVAARGGGQLTPEAVIARNLLRDVEVFVPITFFISGLQGEGLVGAAAFVWLMIFVLFPFFNKDRLRAGDIIAGTWVVEEDRHKLPAAMSLHTPENRSVEARYAFGDAELAVYGEHELQVLEAVLRQNSEVALREVADAICNKIGWKAGAGDERAFLEAFYAALRAHLESGLRFGKRKKDKFA